MGFAKKRHEPGAFRLPVRKGDTVLVLAGKDNGKKGRILEALPRIERVIVEDVQLVTKHQKPRSMTPTAQQAAGRVQKPSPIHVSNVQLVCPSCNQPTRTTRREVEGHTVRFCKHCNEQIDKR